jgi:hypothetical protein
MWVTRLLHGRHLTKLAVLLELYIKHCPGVVHELSTIVSLTLFVTLGARSLRVIPVIANCHARGALVLLHANIRNLNM